ncbi:glycosyltransferase [Roseomonas stagni]|uniref:Glycosyltransferase n=1 Tax=Falsiroseomonas algicola TaxID=2716930 RepID=A0A6M1LEY1_9PROT|nr:glycosyltransferase [Falsiroseomonas algicola]NGM18659.1 glycosyltransferase [Falsiroseomonas algicola]
MPDTAMPLPPSAGEATTRPRRRLIVVAPWPYHPACGIGGGVLCFELLRRLAHRFSIHFLCFDQVPHDREAGLRALGALCDSVTMVPLPAAEGGLADKWGQLSQVPLRLPREARGMRSPAMAAALSRLARQWQPDAVLLQFPQMAQYADDAAGAPVVVDVQDAALVSRFREWRSTEGVARRLTRLVAWLAWFRYELHWYARADGLVALSDNDHGVLRSFFPDRPCLLSPVAAEPRHLPPRGRDGYAAFIGNFDHAPNRDALEWLLGTIWPMVRRAMPSLELHIAGPGIPAWAADEARDGVVIRGFVESLDDFYGAARVALVPYRFGGGTKIKALDAMARGCPVVATPIGAEGLGVTPGVEMEVAGDAVGFGAAVLRLCQDEGAAMRLAEAAHRHLARHFSWDSKVALLAGMLEEIGATRREGAALTPPAG